MQQRALPLDLLFVSNLSKYIYIFIASLHAKYKKEYYLGFALPCLLFLEECIRNLDIVIFS